MVMMCLTTLDVFLRFLFNSPIAGTVELTELMLVVVALFGMAYVGIKKGHVRVELIISRLSPRVQAFINAIISIVSSILFFLITWQSAVHAKAIAVRNLTTTVLYIPIPPFVLVVAFGSALFALVFLIDFCHYLSAVMKNRWKVWEWLIPILILALVGLVAVLLKNSSLSEIDPRIVGYSGLAVLILLIFSGLPIGVCMALVAFLGQLYVRSLPSGFMMLGTVPYSTASSYTLSVLPLFVLMGAFCFYSGISRDLYYSVYKWIGHLPGGLAMATIGACAGFAAVSGSSVASAATFGHVSLPEMRAYKYSDALATGTIAAGGTLGILIPPSVGFILYGMLTGESIGKLFIAGFLPGIILAFFFMVTIYVLCRHNPRLGPPAPVATFKEKMLSLKGVLPVLLLFIVSIGGLWVGVFTATEAAAIGGFGAFIALIIKKTSWNNFVSSLSETVQTTSMVFAILIGAMMLSNFLATTNVPFEMANLAINYGLSRYAVLGAILLILLVLGCIMDSLANMLLTVPIFFPVVLAMGFDPIWFGVVNVIMMEVGLITPPVGMNVYIIHGVAKDVSMYTIFRGVLPFMVSFALIIAMLLLFPQIATILPSLM